MTNEDITGRIIKAAFTVHNELKSGYQEVVYQRALAIELQAEGLDYSREERIPVFYKGKQIDTRRVDFVIEGVIVEIKAKQTLEDRDYIQTLAYLKNSGFKIALLLNFGSESLEIKRFAN